MRNAVVASRYARALYRRAEQEGVVDRVDRDIDVVAGVLESAPMLTEVLRNPLIPREKKAAVFKRLLAEQVHPLVLGLIDLVMRKRREYLLPEVVAVYRQMRDERLGLIDVEAIVARELPEEDVTALKSTLESFTGKTVRLHLHVNPDILGGVVIRIGDRVYDRSVRTQLERLHLRLTGFETA